jgi:hypothetical protein
MRSSIPEGAVALDEAELATINGGSLWAPFVAVFGVGFKAGQWLWCAVECVTADK